MYIVSIHYIAPLSEVDKLMAAHLAYLNHYYAKQIFLASGAKAPRTGGIILANCNTESELRLILEQDPFYTENLAIFEITQFQVSKTTTELTHLLDTTALT